ncbi:hypothetical protein P4261_28110 [Bacillus thuringiensis]|nr:hypothetical protein [Bacillus thuringiensis]MED2829747.1 hypothetical protein [Bacillus thuringiensis]MED2856392.1 hypothetical protein [Bacillus thuringiensis]MED2863803.1 hypothetical protein [Bacillus thuringiensis]
MKKEQIKIAIIALLQENDELLVKEIATKLNDRYHGGYEQYTNEYILELLQEIQADNGVTGGSLELSAPTQEVAQDPTKSGVLVVPLPWDFYYRLQPWKRYTPKAIRRRAVRRMFY